MRKEKKKNEKKNPSQPLYTHPAATPETTFFLRVAFNNLRGKPNTTQNRSKVRFGITIFFHFVMIIPIQIKMMIRIVLIKKTERQSCAPLNLSNLCEVTLWEDMKKEHRLPYDASSFKKKPELTLL